MMGYLLELLRERWKLAYSSVDTDEEDEKETRSNNSKNERCRGFSFQFIIAVVCLGIGFSTGYFVKINSSLLPFQGLQANSCTVPVIRREWRSLTNHERIEYVRAVKCLSTVPSILGLNGTIYDDFGWIHRTVGQYSHQAPSFLPWHRYALHIYEKTLKDECEFKGNLPYWDWSLDWSNLASSSIWDSKEGFGGDGNVTGQVIVGKGRCITDGPFSHFRPIYFNHSYIPHCLSRGFRDVNTLGQLSGFNFRPEAIGLLLLQPTYEKFVEFIEHSVHNIIDNSIGGDSMAFTASNDPIFFLHHAQLDRLWWQWQRLRPDRRYSEYTGQHMVISAGEATLEGQLMMGGMAEDTSVSEVMDTRKGFLCYQY